MFRSHSFRFRSHSIRATVLGQTIVARECRLRSPSSLLAMIVSGMFSWPPLPYIEASVPGFVGDERVTVTVLAAVKPS